MPSYIVEIAIEKNILDQLIKNDYLLCMSNSVSNTTNVATVAMPATGNQAYGPHVMLSWTVEYLVAGNAEVWQQGGVMASTSTEKLPMDIGQCFYLGSASWNDINYDASYRPAQNAFGFKVKELDAAPVVFLKHVTARRGGQNGPLVADLDTTPIYVAPNLVLAPSAANLTPQPQFVIYFLQKVDTAAMVSITDAFLPCTVDLNDHPKPLMTLNDSRRWTVRSA